MIISIIYLVISFLLEGIMSNIFPSTLSNISYFTTIYIIISFAIIYPYFDNDKKFFILIFIFGILFDILYTSTIFVNTFIFIIIKYHLSPQKCSPGGADAFLDLN